MDKRCYIAGAGEFCASKLPEQNDFIIAADGGYAALLNYEITPDLVVGDFDSLGRVPDHPNVIQSNTEKDDTDMMLAVKQGIKLGYKEFIINGGLGGRLDQTLANIQILAYLTDHDSHGILIGNDIHITAIKNGTIDLIPNPDVIKNNNIISIFSHGEKADGITLKGLKYPLNNASLTNGYPIGVSNELTGDIVTISVKSGILIIIYPANTQCIKP